jgi:exopolysaccharide production protein ExoZ
MKLARNKSIDTLRGVAVLMVIIAHLNYLMSSEIKSLYYGRFGVQIFFILTGYIFLQRDSLNNYLLFLKKRAVRLFPLYWMFLIIFLILNLDIKGVIYESLLLNSLNFTKPYGLVPGGWTISIEWIFSIILPLIYRFEKKAVYGLVILFFLNSLFTRDLGEYHNDWFYMNPFNQLWVFVLPVIIGNMRLLATFIFTLLVFSILNPNGQYLYLFAGGILILGVLCNFFINGGYYVSIISTIGQHSYGIYLMHFLILELAMRMTDLLSNWIVILFWIISSIYLGIFLDIRAQKYVKL